MVTYPPMLLAGLFAGMMCVLLVALDWFQFTSLTAQASRYGCGIARRETRLPRLTLSLVADRFDAQGILHLPHGVARWFREERRISLRPHYGLFSMRFRTAWPMKGTVELEEEDQALRLTCIKRVPWSSALLTLLWFGVVGLGTIWFLIAFLWQGGLNTLGGALLGLGIVGAGLLVLAFGLVTVSLAYRLEDSRLSQVFEELHLTLASAPAPLVPSPADPLAPLRGHGR